MLDGRRYWHRHSHPPKRSGGTYSSSSAAWLGVGWAGRALCDLPCGSQKLLRLAQTEPWGKTQLCFCVPASSQLRCRNSMKASSSNSKPQKASALGCQFRAPASSSHTAAACTCSRTELVADCTHTAPAPGRRCTEQHGAVRQGLSNQPATLSSSPLRQRQLLFHCGVLHRKQGE